MWLTPKTWIQVKIISWCSEGTLVTRALVGPITLQHVFFFFSVHFLQLYWDIVNNGICVYVKYTTGCSDIYSHPTMGCHSDLQDPDTSALRDGLRRSCAKWDVLDTEGEVGHGCLEMRSVTQCSVQTSSRLTLSACMNWVGEEVFNFEVLGRSGFIQSS